MDLGRVLQAGCGAPHVADSFSNLPVSSKWPSAAFAGSGCGHRRGTPVGSAQIPERLDLALGGCADSKGIRRVSLFGDHSVPEFSRLDAGAGGCRMVGSRPFVKGCSRRRHAIMRRMLAIITGASSGLGATFARKLAARGYDLLLIARREDRLQSIAYEIREQYHVHAEILAADLTNAAALSI